MKIASRNEIRKIDEQSISKLMVPGVILMENAGRTTAEVISTQFPDSNNISLFCGSGNNGGDGFVIARHLMTVYNKKITVYMCADVKKISGDALANFLYLKNLKCKIINLKNDFSNYENCDLIVDAIFGTGLVREIKGFYSKIIEFINNQKLPVVSVDIPSGLDSDTGRPLGNCINADVTVTYGLPKIGMCLFPGLRYCGRIFLSNITTQKKLEDRLKTELITSDDILEILQERDKDTHKGSYGHLLILSGSPGKTGAATLSATGSLRIGTGLTTVGVPESLNPVLEEKLTEAMTFPVSETKDATFGETSIKQVLKLVAEKKTALAIGPGISVTRNTEKFLFSLLSSLEIPTVLDADALTLISRNFKVLKKVKYPVVLTPHTGEMSRLCGKSTSEIQKNRIKISRQFATEHNIYLVLKGARTIVASPDGMIYINPTGNPGMATGGTGDVLTGVIGGLLAQGYSPLDSCRAGVYIHGLAGDLVSEKMYKYGYTASELADFIPFAIRSLDKTIPGAPIIRAY